VQRRLGVPYPETTEDEIIAEAKAEAATIAADLRTAGARVEDDREIVSLIAYLQRLGKLEARPKATAPLSAIEPKQGGSRVP
jgi:cytochrome c oxidase cbb3-type subunit I/II